MGISLTRSSSVVHMLNPCKDEEVMEQTHSERGNSPNPSESEINDLDGSGINPNLGPGKAYYYSQLSVMLFEKAVQENANFPEDLDRVHSWFVKDLSDTQKLVCLHELLSLMTPAQHRFLFTSVCFDSLQSSEDETVWLDLAMSDTQKKERVEQPSPMLDNVVSKLEALDLTLGDSIFSGVKVAKNKLNFDRSASPSPKPTVDVIRASPVLSDTSKTSKFSSFMKSADEVEDRTSILPPLKVDSSSTSEYIPISPSPSESTLMGKAPPGFLSPNAKEFRPSEPSCHADVYLVDFAQWLRLLRLHKYTDSLLPLYTADRIALLKTDEAGLEAAGVAAMGARRKFLRLFERIQQEGGVGKE